MRLLSSLSNWLHEKDPVVDKDRYKEDPLMSGLIRVSGPLKRRETWQEETKKLELEHEKEMKRAREVMFPNLKPAKWEDYTNWLAGYVMSGGKITNIYDYGLERSIDDFFVAKRDFEVVPLDGAQAIKVIVPEDIQFKGEKLGHNSLYLHAGPRALGHSVPIYKDILQVLRNSNMDKQLDKALEDAHY